MKKLGGSVTVEAAVIIPLFLGIFAVLVHVLFYFHDKNVATAVMHETLVLQSAKEEIQSEEVENYFRSRLRGKLLLFADASPSATVEDDRLTLQCRARKKRFGFAIELQMKRTEPEDYIRRLKRIEDVGDEVKNQIGGQTGEE